MKKIYRYCILLTLGLSAIFYGVIHAVIEDKSTVEPSDAEIIRRARELGMVGLDELYLKDVDDNE